MPDIALFLRCGTCSHKLSAFLAFRNAGLLVESRRPTVSDIEAIAPRLKCSQCGAKSVALESEQYKDSERYWATSESEHRVFHRSTCTWMRSASCGAAWLHPLPGLQAARAAGAGGWAAGGTIGAAILLGAAALLCLERWLPHEHFIKGVEGQASRTLRRTWLFVYAIAQYLEGTEGRLMRSLKSLLGSALLQDKTAVHNQLISYQDVISLFLRMLAQKAQAELGGMPGRVLMGRPVHFVDDDPTRDQQAEDALRQAALDAGFENVSFQLEPIAAASKGSSSAMRARGAAGVMGAGY
eukprot:gene26200-32740_t